MTVTSASSFLCVIQEYIVYPLGIGQDRRDDDWVIASHTDSGISSVMMETCHGRPSPSCRLFFCPGASTLCLCIYINIYRAEAEQRDTS
jgi:hypothetical protein